MKTDIKIKYFLTNIKPPFKDTEIDLNANTISYFWFIENIENMFLTGEIKFIDKGGFFETLPLTGEESIKVVIEQTTENKDDSSKDIHITKTIIFDISQVEIEDIPNDRQVYYKLKLIEENALDFYNAQYSKSYVNKPYSDIVKDICKSILQLNSNQYEIETTNGIVSNYIIPYWKINTTLRDICKKSQITASSSEGGFLFYSTTNNTSSKIPIKKFVSFNSLINQVVEKEEYQKYYLKRNDINPRFRNIFKEVRNPEYAKRSAMATGLSGKKYFGLELEKDKKIFTVENTYTNFIKNTTLLGKVAYFTEDLDDVNNDVDVLGYTESEIKANQTYNFRILLQGYNRREAIVSGSLDRWAGKVIYVQQTSDNHGDALNSQDSGKWLIKQVTHFFSMGSFEQKIIILKDSYNTSDLKNNIRK